MTSPNSNQLFLLSSRAFPQEARPLSLELTKTYLDIAQNVNARTIGVFATIPGLTGEGWYLDGSSSRQSTLRRVYRITGDGTYAHGIDTATFGGFTKIHGTFTDGTDWYPLPYVDAAAADAQIALSITATDITITSGGGAPPTITSGFVILEWLS